MTTRNIQTRAPLSVVSLRQVPPPTAGVSASKKARAFRFVTTPVAERRRMGNPTLPRAMWRKESLPVSVVDLTPAAASCRIETKVISPADLGVDKEFLQALAEESLAQGYELGGFAPDEVEGHLGFDTVSAVVAGGANWVEAVLPGSRLKIHTHAALSSHPIDLAEAVVPSAYAGANRSDIIPLMRDAVLQPGRAFSLVTTANRLDAHEQPVSSKLTIVFDALQNNFLVAVSLVGVTTKYHQRTAKQISTCVLDALDLYRMATSADLAGFCEAANSKKNQVAADVVTLEGVGNITAISAYAAGIHTMQIVLGNGAALQVRLQLRGNRDTRTLELVDENVTVTDLGSGATMGQVKARRDPRTSTQIHFIINGQQAFSLNFTLKERDHGDVRPTQLFLSHRQSAHIDFGLVSQLPQATVGTVRVMGIEEISARQVWGSQIHRATHRVLLSDGNSVTFSCRDDHHTNLLDVDGERAVLTRLSDGLITPLNIATAGGLPGTVIITGEGYDLMVPIVLRGVKAVTDVAGARVRKAPEMAWADFSTLRNLQSTMPLPTSLDGEAKEDLSLSVRSVTLENAQEGFARIHELIADPTDRLLVPDAASVKQAMALVTASQTKPVVMRFSGLMACHALDRNAPDAAVMEFSLPMRFDSQQRVMVPVTDTSGQVTLPHFVCLLPQWDTAENIAGIDHVEARDVTAQVTWEESGNGVSGWTLSVGGLHFWMMHTDYAGSTTPIVGLVATGDLREPISAAARYELRRSFGRRVRKAGGLSLTPGRDSGAEERDEEPAEDRQPENDLETSEAVAVDGVRSSEQLSPVQAVVDLSGPIPIGDNVRFYPSQTDLLLAMGLITTGALTDRVTSVPLRLSWGDKNGNQAHVDIFIYYDSNNAHSPVKIATGPCNVTFNGQRTPATVLHVDGNRKALKIGELLLPLMSMDSGTDDCKIWLTATDSDFFKTNTSRVFMMMDGNQYNAPKNPLALAYFHGNGFEFEYDRAAVDDAAFEQGPVWMGVQLPRGERIEVLVEKNSTTGKFSLYPHSNSLGRRRIILPQDPDVAYCFSLVDRRLYTFSKYQAFEIFSIAVTLILDTITGKIFIVSMLPPYSSVTRWTLTEFRKVTRREPKNLATYRPTGYMPNAFDDETRRQALDMSAGKQDEIDPAETPPVYTGWVGDLLNFIKPVFEGQVFELESPELLRALFVSSLSGKAVPVEIAYGPLKFTLVVKVGKSGPAFQNSITGGTETLFYDDGGEINRVSDFFDVDNGMLKLSEELVREAAGLEVYINFSKLQLPDDSITDDERVFLLKITPQGRILFCSNEAYESVNSRAARRGMGVPALPELPAELLRQEPREARLTLAGAQITEGAYTYKPVRRTNDQLPQGDAAKGGIKAWQGIVLPDGSRLELELCAAKRRWDFAFVANGQCVVVRFLQKDTTEPVTGAISSRKQMYEAGRFKIVMIPHLGIAVALDTHTGDLHPLPLTPRPGDDARTRWTEPALLAYWTANPKRLLGDEGATNKDTAPESSFGDQPEGDEATPPVTVAVAELLDRVELRVLELMETQPERADELSARFDELQRLVRSLTDENRGAVVAALEYALSN